MQPLFLLFHNSINSLCYFYTWESSNIIPVHKKNEKHLVKIYRPVSLLLMFGKIFENIFFNSLCNFFLDKKLLNPNQFGFRPTEPRINQLLTVTHEIIKGFYCNPSLKVSSVFLDISKAFDKLWIHFLLYKLKSMGISGELYNLLGNYLSGRFQRVALNRQASSWKPVLAGAPQSLILESLHFLIYTNKLPNEIKTMVKRFGDDTYFFTTIKDINESANALRNVSLISKCTFNWKMPFNLDRISRSITIV